MRISDWSSDVCSSDLGRSPASEIVIDLCRGHDPGIPDVAVLVQEADRSLRQVRHVDRLLGGQAADLDAAFEPATVRLHVDEQDGTDVVRQGQGEGHQPSPSSGSWSLTTDRKSVGNGQSGSVSVKL